MKDCNDKYYEKIVTLHAFPLDDCWFQFSSYLPGRTLFGDYYLPKDKKYKIPTISDSAEISEKSSLSDAGENMEITVSWETEIGNSEDLELLEFLKNNVCNILVTTFPDNNLLVRANKESYTFSYVMDDGYYSCELVVNNTSGILPLDEVKYK